MEFRPAGLEDVVTYAAQARAAQAWLQSRGLQQYVPAVHEEYASATRSKAEAGILYAVETDRKPVGFFVLDASPSPWWPADGVAAMYLAGMVVAQSARGLGVGNFIIEWCVAETVRRGHNSCGSTAMPTTHGSADTTRPTDSNCRASSSSTPATRAACISERYRDKPSQ